MKKKKLILLIISLSLITTAILAALCFLSFNVAMNHMFGSNRSDRENIRTACLIGDITEIPKSATDIKTFGWSSFFSGEVWVKFKAPPEDIEAFIENSEGLKGITPEPFSGECFPYEYTDDLPWFKPPVKNTVQYELTTAFGVIIVDYENNVVYIDFINE
jgi:hypothetical protein